MFKNNIFAELNDILFIPFPKNIDFKNIDFKNTLFVKNKFIKKVKKSTLFLLDSNDKESFMLFNFDDLKNMFHIEYLSSENKNGKKLVNTFLFLFYYLYYEKGFSRFAYFHNAAMINGKRAKEFYRENWNALRVNDDERELPIEVFDMERISFEKFVSPSDENEFVEKSDLEAIYQKYFSNESESLLRPKL